MNKELEAALGEEFPFMRREKQDSASAYQSFGIEAGSGWYELIRKLCRELMEACAQAGRENDLVVDQVKEKYGELRFYFHLEGGTVEENAPLNHRLYDMIERYEETSKQVCELCGAPGELRELKLRGGMVWYQTLCDEHYASRQEKLNP